VIYEIIFFGLFVIINLITIYKLSSVAKFFKLIDRPSGRLHKKNTPKFGFFLFGYIIIFIFQFNLILNFNYKILFLNLFYFSFFIIGYLDDRYEINVVKRFFLAAISVIFFYQINFNDYYISNLFNPEINFILLCFFTLGFIHLINITDGINGLVPLLFLYSLIYYFIKSYGEIDFQIELLIILSIIGISIYIIPNFFGFCFLGNIGSYLVAVITATIYMELYKINILEYSDIIMIFYIPLLDGLRVTLKRISNNKNPFQGDFSHLHHLIRGKPKWIFLYFTLIFLPSFFNFFYKDLTIIIAIIALINYLLFVNKHAK